jgi:predicted aldo/keto reductase-like oxidoreductase
MNSLEQLTENIALMNNFKPFDAKEWEVIKKVTEIIKRNIAIPCTACVYCTVCLPIWTVKTSDIAGMLCVIALKSFLQAT